MRAGEDDERDRPAANPRREAQPRRKKGDSAHGGINDTTTCVSV